MSDYKAMREVENWSEKVKAPYWDGENRWIKLAANGEMALYFILLNLEIRFPEAYESSVKELRDMADRAPDPLPIEA